MMYRGRVDPSEEFMIRRKIWDVMKEASELCEQILLSAQSVVDAQVTIHVCCFLGKFLLSLLQQRFRCFVFACVDLYPARVLFKMLLQRSLN